MDETYFEKKLKPALSYVGAIGASIMTVAYILVMFILVFGFKVTSVKQSLIFAVVTGVVGIVIMQFLKIQGIDFAKQLPRNKEVLKENNDLKAELNLLKKRDEKLHSMTYFWITSLIKDILVKVLTIVATTTGIIYIVIEGSNDYSLLLLAATNLLMFVCFGFLALCKGFEFYNNENIPFLLHKNKQMKEDIEIIRNNKSIEKEEEICLKSKIEN